MSVLFNWDILHNSSIASRYQSSLCLSTTVQSLYLCMLCKQYVRCSKSLMFFSQVTMRNQMGVLAYAEILFCPSSSLVSMLMYMVEKELAAFLRRLQPLLRRPGTGIVAALQTDSSLVLLGRLGLDRDFCVALDAGGSNNLAHRRLRIALVRLRVPQKLLQVHPLDHVLLALALGVLGCRVA